MADLLKINDYLKAHYGITLDGKAKYRVVWSTGLTEKRFSTFRDYYGHILVREETGVRELLKYPYDQNRWVLEVLVPNVNNKELLTKETYEPIWVFKKKDGSFLPLNRRAIEYFMGLLLNGSPVSKDELEEEDKKRYRQEIEYYKDYFGDIMSDPNQMDLVE